MTIQSGPVVGSTQLNVAAHKQSVLLWTIYFIDAGSSFPSTFISTEHLIKWMNDLRSEFCILLWSPNKRQRSIRDQRGPLLVCLHGDKDDKRHAERRRDGDREAPNRENWFYSVSSQQSSLAGTVGPSMTVQRPDKFNISNNILTGFILPSWRFLAVVMS